VAIMNDPSYGGTSAEPVIASAATARSQCPSLASAFKVLLDDISLDDILDDISLLVAN